MEARVVPAVFCAVLLVAAPFATGRASAAPGIVGTHPIASGLAWPVSFAFAPDGRLFYNERFTGRVMAIPDGGGPPEQVANVSVLTDGEQGLLGLALDPDFETSPWVYVHHTTFDGGLGGPVNRVVRILLGVPPRSETLVDRIPAAAFHNGGILGFAPDGTLFVTTGDATDRASAQDLASLAGKVLRVLRDGRVPPDNPFPGSFVYSLGHRNVFGLGFQSATGRPYVSENGPSEDDEVNALVPGGNYGWPDVTGTAGMPGLIDPIWTYPAIIAPTGLAFCASCGVSAWEGDLFLGDWNRGILQRIDLAPQGDRAVGVEDLWSFGARGVLDVETGPDGHLYASTSDAIYRMNAGEVLLPAPLFYTILLAISVVAVAASVSFILVRVRRRARTGRRPPGAS